VVVLYDYDEEGSTEPDPRSSSISEPVQAEPDPTAFQAAAPVAEPMPTPPPAPEVIAPVTQSGAAAAETTEEVPVATAEVSAAAEAPPVSEGTSPPLRHDEPAAPVAEPAPRVSPPTETGAAHPAPQTPPLPSVESPTPDSVESEVVMPAAAEAEVVMPDASESEVITPEVAEAEGATKTVSAPKHAMRTPSIGNEATELLNGSKPVQRELPRIIAIANQKGGVGKTTTTVNLGAALAELDYRVLVIDLDPQGNATTGLGVEARNFEMSMYDVIMRDQPLEDCIEPTSVKNLFVAPATIDLAGVEIELVPAFSREMKLKRAIDTVVDDFDFVLIDCPPSLGLITVNGLAAADEVLVPIQCEYYALEGLSQLLRNVNLVSTNLNQTLEVSTIVLTMYDARTRLSVDVANEVREHFSERVCRAVIPRTVRLSEAPSFGQPITVFDPASRGAVAYRELAKEVSNGAPQRTR
jgi:chromosome partitioning protein